MHIRNLKQIFELLELRQVVIILMLLIAWYSMCDSLRTLFSHGLARNGCTVAVSVIIINTFIQKKHDNYCIGYTHVLPSSTILDGAYLLGCIFLLVRHQSDSSLIECFGICYTISETKC